MGLSGPLIVVVAAAVVFGHAQGTAPWNMFVFSKHGLWWGGVGC